MDRSVDTHCPYCALQCAMRLEVSAGTVSVSPRDFPTNRGGLCQKGWTSAELLTTPDRLTQPLVRGRSGDLEPATWDQAYDRIVDAVTRSWAERGREGVAVFGGGGLTNEKAYALGKFARVHLGTSLIDYNGRFCMSSAAAAGNRAFGLDRGLPFPLSDLGGADAVLLIGSNLAETMPPAIQHLSEVRARGGLIVVDPRRSATARLTEDGAGVHLAPRPGSDLTLLLGILHTVLAKGVHDEEYLRQRVVGFQEARRSVATLWPEVVEQQTGVTADEIRSAARTLADASPHRGGSGAYVLTGRGAEQHAHGTDTVTAAINLALALGLPGRVGSGYGCLTGQGNGQGGREHGQKSDQLPGYRKIDDVHARRHVANVWGVEADSLPGPGVPAVELIDRLGRPDGPSVLFVHGANPAVSAPDATAVRERLSALDLLVVSDFVPSETAQLADVVLPVPQWAEEDGTMTSLEGRVLLRRKAIEPPGEVRGELRIWSDLAARLSGAAENADAATTLEELGRASAGGVADYGGVTRERLESGEALYWPCPDTDHPGTPRALVDRFATEDGRARMVPVRPAAVADDIRPGATTYLLTGRLLQHYQSGAQTRRVTQLTAAEPAAFVQMHPDHAERLGVEEGADALVTSSRGSVVAVARFSEDVRPGTVFMPFHFARGCVNEVTNSTTDPISGMPEFKVCAVSVTPYDGSESGE